MESWNPITFKLARFVNFEITLEDNHVLLTNVSGNKLTDLNSSSDIGSNLSKSNVCFYKK